MGSIVNILKNIGLFALVVSALGVLGWGLNAIIPWGWLTIIFAIAYKLLNLISFMWDIETLWQVLGYALNIMIIYWLFRATMTAIRFFQNKNAE